MRIKVLLRDAIGFERVDVIEGDEKVLREIKKELSGELFYITEFQGEEDVVVSSEIVDIIKVV